jgi:hypothetical protein
MTKRAMRRTTAAVAALALTLMAGPARAETPGGHEAATAKPAEGTAPSNTSPQIANNPSLAEEAPHRVPVLQPPASMQPAPKSDANQSGVSDEAPHIVPVAPEGPAPTQTRAPVEGPAPVE